MWAVVSVDSQHFCLAHFVHCFSFVTVIFAFLNKKNDNSDHDN